MIRLELPSTIRKLNEFKNICINCDKILSIFFILSTPKIDAILESGWGVIVLSTNQIGYSKAWPETDANAEHHYCMIDSRDKARVTGDRRGERL